ncbi:hypothetical protein BGZ65_001278 [Modicella reniformis]|uniref:DNA polymerase lambda n=1 Tax=Modicella reniformis TaxID=1440133 RepID=A0A9P6ILX2_9FUNG|nr:hypothetical protein BGZ65_001278 [Modicella reniformis]
MSRPPKKFRPPVSIFDLPCPPTAAPPHDNKSFFTHLDSVQQSLEEEDEGKIPKALEAGPEILVESLYKRRRRIQQDPELEMQLSFTGSVESTSSSHTGRHPPEQQKPPKNVRFNLELNEVYEIPRSSKRRRHSSRALTLPDASTSTTTATSRSRSPPPRTGEDESENYPPDTEEADEDWDAIPHYRGLPAEPASSSSSSNSSNGSTSTPPALAVGGTNNRARKSKEPIQSVASKIGCRRKPTTTSFKIPSLQRSPSIVALDDTSDDELFLRDARGTPALPTSYRTDPPPRARSAPAATSLGSNRLSAGTSGRPLFATSSRPLAETSSGYPIPSTSKQSTPGPGRLAELYIYVMPQNMDSVVFNLMRDRVQELKGHWLGPKTKSLATDPRANTELPALDQEKTTHIVTSLTNIQAVKRHLNVEDINPKIAVVNREWLSDTITYKRPMEPASYTLSRPEIGAPLKPLQQDTPPSSQTHRSAEKQPASAMMNNVHQLDFEVIMQGIQEGSLEDVEMSNTDEGEDEAKDDGENKDEPHQEDIHPESTAQREADLQRALGVSPEAFDKLKRENRCFKCQQVGHWMRRCPKRPLEINQEDILLQTIYAARNEAKRRKTMHKCQSPHVAGMKDEPRYNKAIIDQLRVLMKHYDNIKHKGSNENFKVINYRRAINAIQALDYELTSEEMALKVPCVGKKIAKKIGECIALGRIKKLDHLNWDKDRLQVETIFRSIYGVGAEKATDWYDKGLRTLDDIRQLPDLNKNQIAGLRYYDDLQKRVTRAEVEQIAKVVEDIAKDLHPDIQCQVTGSYRRGQPDCGDIDIVVARPEVDDGDELFAIVEHIRRELTSKRFLVDHLAEPGWSVEMANQPRHFKYMGICRLPGENSLHRHIDILVVPWKHLGAALLYFTGNDICNRSMRHLARKRGLRLNDKGLYENVIRDKHGKKINEGQWVAGRTEREIFDYLKIDYLEPFERQC